MTLQFTSLLLSAILLGRAECNRICSLNDVLQNISLASIPGANIRPVKNWQTPSEVFIHVTLYSIVSLDTSSQTLTTYIWLYLKWKNEFISWNPVDFCDIDEVTSLGDTLWKPDLYIYQLVEPDDKNPVIPYYRIQNDGDIVSSKPLRIISSCNINIFKFPFDTQTCNLTFGSFIYTVEDIIMFPSLNSSEVSQLSLDSFVSKGDWSLLDVAVVNQSLVGDGQFSEVTYMITMKRSSVVFVINLIVPACFLIFLDFASMFIRIGETLEFKITIVLGFSVLLLILNDMMPSSDNPPMLGIFCVVCLAIMVISILGCILTNYMLTLSDMQPNVPNWIKTLILKHLARILFFKLYKNEQNLVVSVDTDPGVSKAYNQPDMELQKKKKDSDKEIKITPEVRLLKKLLDEVLKINQNLKLSKNEQDAKSEWYMAALVVDRLILFLYLIIVIIIFIVLIIVWAK